MVVYRRFPFTVEQREDRSGFDRLRQEAELRLVARSLTDRRHVRHAGARLRTGESGTAEKVFAITDRLVRGPIWRGCLRAGCRAQMALVRDVVLRLKGKVLQGNLCIGSRSSQAPTYGHTSLAACVHRDLGLVAKRVENLKQ